MKKSILAIYVLSITANANVFNPSTIIELNDALSTAALNAEDDTINLLGTYLTGDSIDGFLVIPKINNSDTITIVGDGETTTILQGDSNNPIFHVNNLWNDYPTYSPTFVFKNMTITDGSCPAYSCSGGDNESAILNGVGMNIELENVTLTDNVSRRGAITGYNVKATNVTGNTNSAYDGGVLYSLSTMYVKDSSFNGNSANWSGGVVKNDGQGDTLAFTTIINSKFKDNTALKFGGAIDTIGHTLSITSSSFTNNKVTQGNGGAITSREKGTIVIDNSVFTNNAATFNGNPEHCEEGAVERSFCLSEGGAISIDDYYGAMLTVTNSSFVNNAANGAGGAIGLDGTCSTQYPDPRFPENCPAYAGQVTAATHSISDTVFEGNTAGVFNSGAIYTSEGTVLGGATWTYGDIDFTNVTFIGNDVYSSSGVLDVEVQLLPVVVIPEEEVSGVITPKESSGGGTSLLGLLLLSAISLVRRNKLTQ